jgi:chromosome segregation ATPase
MTNEEVERAIDFLLKSQANSEARIEQTNEQLNQLADHLGSFADTQTDMMRVMTRTLEAQDYINESLRASIGELAARTEVSITELAAKQSKTEEALARLADAQAGTDRRLGALIKIVEDERGGR